MVIYSNKEKPWKGITVSIYKYEKRTFYRFKRVKKHRWMRKPRFHVMINLFLFSIWRDNSNFRLGVGFGKKQLSLNFHNLL